MIFLSKVLLSFILVATLTFVNTPITLSQTKTTIDATKSITDNEDDSDEESEEERDRREAENTAAEVFAAAEAAGVMLEVGVVEAVYGASPSGSGVTVGGVTLGKEEALAAISAMGSAKSVGALGVVSVEKTLAAYGRGDVCSGCVIGENTGVTGRPEQVAHAEADYLVSTSNVVGIRWMDDFQKATGDVASALNNLRINPLGGLLDVNRVMSNLNNTNLIPPADIPGVEVVKTPEPIQPISPGIQPEPYYDQLTEEQRLIMSGYNPDGSYQRAMTIDYENLRNAAPLTNDEYIELGIFDSVRSVRINMLAMSMNSNIDQASLSPLTLEAVQEYGQIDRGDTNGAFAKSIDTYIAPDLWDNSNTTGKRQLMTSYFANIVGYTPQQAAGIVGNAAAESGYDRLIDAAGSERSSGLFQWNAASAAGQRRQALENWGGQEFTGFYRENGREYWTDGPGAFTQLSFVVAEMRGTAGNGHRDTGAERTNETFSDNPNMTAAEAAKIFQNHFERPADRIHSLTYRQNEAGNALSDYNSISPAISTFTNVADSKPKVIPGSSQDETPNIAITIDTPVGTVEVRPFQLIENLFGIFKGTGTSSGNTTQYTDFSELSNHAISGSDSVVDASGITQVTIRAIKPQECSEKSLNEGFYFTIQLKELGYPIGHFKCTGNTPEDYFQAISQYLSDYGYKNLNLTEVLKNMEITNQ